MQKDQGKRHFDRAYLLRCWREDDVPSHAGASWRFSVEEIWGERRRWGFGSLERLVAFLREQLEGERGIREQGRDSEIGKNGGAE